LIDRRKYRAVARWDVFSAENMSDDKIEGSISGVIGRRRHPRITTRSKPTASARERFGESAVAVAEV
jgi:hypothetical protein